MFNFFLELRAPNILNLQLHRISSTVVNIKSRHVTKQVLSCEQWFWIIEMEHNSPQSFIVTEIDSVQRNSCVSKSQPLFLLVRRTAVSLTRPQRDDARKERKRGRREEIKYLLCCTQHFVRRRKGKPACHHYQGYWGLHGRMLLRDQAAQTAHHSVITGAFPIHTRVLWTGPLTWQWIKLYSTSLSWFNSCKAALRKQKVCCWARLCSILITDESIDFGCLSVCVYVMLPQVSIFVKCIRSTIPIWLC
jgi:hypothetical protein